MRWDKDRILSGSDTQALAAGTIRYDDGLAGLTSRFQLSLVKQGIEVLETLGYRRAWFRLAHNHGEDAPLLAMTPTVEGRHGVLLAPVLPTEGEETQVPGHDDYNLMHPARVDEVARRLEDRTDLDEDDITGVLEALVPEGWWGEGADGAEDEDE